VFSTLAKTVLTDSFFDFNVSFVLANFPFAPHRDGVMDGVIEVRYSALAHRARQRRLVYLYIIIVIIIRYNIMNCI